MAANPNAGNSDPLDQWIPKKLRDYIVVALVILVFDSVFRGIAILQLFTYMHLIGPFYTVLKLTAYIAGIVGNVAVLRRQKWGVFVGLVAAAIGFWLIAIDAWSLLHSSFGPRLLDPGPFFVIRNLIKTLGRGAWLAVYVMALLVYAQRDRAR